MPTLNPWIYLGVVIAFVAVGLGGYFYGHAEGVKSEKAELVDGYQKALDDYSAAAVKVTKDATASALQDFQDRTKVLDDLAAKIEGERGVINAAASRLSDSLKGGSCVLAPAQRALLECVRRPGSAGCSPPSTAAAH